jgi:ferric-dicitrate binding protein FerR (iron transport regulator)
MTDDPVGRLIRLAGPRPAVPEERLGRIRAVVHASWRQSVGRDRRRGLAAVIGWPLATAAAIAVLVGGFYWLHDRGRGAGTQVATIVRAEGRVLRLDGRAAESGGRLDEGGGVATGPDGRAALRTRDGVSVRVDSGTEMRLTAAGVLELERGAIYVDTRGSALLRALEVRTRLGTISDVGTQFEVRLAGDGLQLTVRTGAARLARGGTMSPAPAGTRLRVDSGGAVETSGVAADGSDWDWVEAIAPPFEIEGRTLGDYLDWLAQETGWQVTFAEASMAGSARTIVLHGSTSGLRPGDTPDAVLPACGLRPRLEGGVLVISPAATR